MQNETHFWSLRKSPSVREIEKSLKKKVWRESERERERSGDEWRLVNDGRRECTKGERLLNIATLNCMRKLRSWMLCLCSYTECIFYANSWIIKIIKKKILDFTSHTEIETKVHNVHAISIASCLRVMLSKNHARVYSWLRDRLVNKVLQNHTKIQHFVHVGDISLCWFLMHEVTSHT